MTPSQTAKAAGLKNLLEVQTITGVSAQTLTNWHSSKPDLFKIVLAGCVTMRSIEAITESSEGKTELSRLELHHKILHLRWMAETSGEALKRSMLSLADQLEGQL